jgi:glycosyltransferase involved in cell wall biosynthesis
LRRVLCALRLDPSRKFGSLEEQVFLMARLFQERGGLFLPVFPAPPEPTGRALYQGAGLEYVALDLDRFRLGTLNGLLRLVARRGIEVVHWNFFPPLTNGYVWAMSALAPRVKHFLTDHNSRPPGARAGRGRLPALRRLLLRRYARVVGVSEFVVSCLRAQQVWPAADCLLHFINTDRFAPDPEARAAVRRQLDAEGRFVLLTAAYLIQAKGVDVAVRALARLTDSVVLWVVGDGEELPALEALAARLNLSRRVRFLGLRPRVEPYMQAADAFACPSLWAEAAGLVNIEAQACGLPVLASRIGGIPEYVVDGRTGLLFPPGDSEALALAIRKLLDDPAALQAMSARARELALERFSAPARIGEHLGLYLS